MPQHHEEPWDELMGPPPPPPTTTADGLDDEVDKFLRGEVTLTAEPSSVGDSDGGRGVSIPRIGGGSSTTTTPRSSSSHHIRQKSVPTPPPPSYAFTRSGSNQSGGGVAGGFGSMPERWAKHTPTLEETKAATQRAVALAAEFDPVPAYISSSASVSSASSAISFQASGKARRQKNAGVPMEEDPDHHYTSDEYSTDHENDEASYTNYPSKADPPETSSQHRERERLAYERDARDRVYSHRDAGQIRQDALKVLQVVDDTLASSANSSNPPTYSVHRTITGGFMASASPMGTKKRIPTALSGLSFTASGRSSRTFTSSTTKPYRDRPDEAAEDVVPYQDQPKLAYQDPSKLPMPKNPPPPPPDAYEYADDDAVDYINSKRDGPSATPTTTGSPSANNWSSRYSIDNTLLALSGGATPTSSRKFLDHLDAESSSSPTTASLFGSGRSPSKVFGGSSFHFNHKNVFGKPTSPVSPPQTNLRTVWIDIEKEHRNGDTDSESGSTEPKRSWHEQLLMKKRQRRAYIFILMAICIFAITVATVASKSKKEAAAAASSAAAMAAAAAGSTLFYATANVPLTTDQDATLTNELSALDSNAKFLVHLGNIQDPSVTQCGASQYSDVAALLANSPIPVFVLPGKNDWINCPDPQSAWTTWYNTFPLFDTRFAHDFPVARQIDRIENFAFELNGVLFIGIDLVGGNMTSADQLSARDADDFSWIQIMVADHTDATSIVMFGNAGPADANNINFFRGLSTYLDTLSQPSMYVHAADDVAQGGEQSYWVNNIFTVQVDNGATRLTELSVAGTGSRPFAVVS